MSKKILIMLLILTSMLIIEGCNNNPKTWDKEVCRYNNLTYYESNRGDIIYCLDLSSGEVKGFHYEYYEFIELKENSTFNSEYEYNWIED